jgi:hypothetical protein
MIIVTGMHRSGTSFVAQLLHELGMDLGDLAQMYATDEWNAAGYFENLAVMMLNDRIVLGDRFYAEAFRANAPQDRPLRSRLLMSLARARYLVLRSTAGVARRAEHRRGELGRLGRRFPGMVVKDPRFSLTIGAWRKYADVQRVLYCYRHPREVAMSIRRRDRLPQWLGLRLWAFHVEAFLAGAEGLPVTFVDFNRFFDGASAPAGELARCFAFAERPYDEATAARVLARVRRGDLKHQTTAAASLPETCRRLYEQLNACHACYDRPRAFAGAPGRPPRPTPSNAPEDGGQRG